MAKDEISNIYYIDDEFMSGDHPQYILVCNAVFPRVAGAITFCSASYMIVMAWHRRQFLFHNLVFAMAIHTLTTGIFLMYGIAAIPGDDPHVLGDVGTQVTCDIQGFFLWVSGTTADLYFGSFSVYIYVCIINKFEKSKIDWIEKWIHLVVHIYPLSTGIYFLVVDVYANMGIGFCGPVILGHDIDTIWFHIGYKIIMFVIPTCTMIHLYLRVRRDQAKIPIQAKLIAQIGIFFGFFILWTNIPLMISNIVTKKASHVDVERLYFFYLFAATNYTLFGFWFMMAYKYYLSFVRKIFKHIAKEQKRIEQEEELKNYRKSKNLVSVCFDPPSDDDDESSGGGDDNDGGNNGDRNNTNLSQKEKK